MINVHCYFSWLLRIVPFKNCVHFPFWIAKVEKKMPYNNVLLFVTGSCLGAGVYVKGRIASTETCCSVLQSH